jgi:hypothetical protein
MDTKNIKEIKIGFRCHEEWSKMNVSNSERHCELCNKSVFDFSNLSIEEIFKFLRERKGDKTCGKFDTYQLSQLNKSINNNSNSSFIKPYIFGASITTFLACNTSKKICDTNHLYENSKFEVVSEIVHPDSTNTILIKGQIFDETNQPLIGANFYLYNSKIGCSTDLNGKFELKVNKDEIKSETASVEYVGYEILEIPLIDIRNRQIKISMVESGALLGEVVIIKQPIHKRFWQGIKNVFRIN